MRVPLRATCLWIKFIYRCLELLGKPKAFEIFAPDPERAAILAECKVGPLSVASCAAVSQWKAPPVLTVTSDQEQIQISGANFMKSALDLMLVLFRDFFHRVHNDFATAMSKAGFMPIFHASIVLLNLGYGPYQTSGWWHAMLAEAAELAVKAKPNNPALVKLWPWIQRSSAAASPGAASACPGGDKARQDFLNRLHSTSCNNLRTGKVSMGQWMSFSTSYKEHKDFFAARAFVLLNYVVDKKHASSIVDIEASVAKHIFAVKEAEAKSKSKEVQNARQKIDDFKKRATSHLCMAVQLLLDADVMRGMAAISRGVLPIYKWFMDAMRNIKGGDSCAAFSQKWATFSWLEPLKETILCLEDAAGLEEIGLTMAFRSTVLSPLTERDPTVMYEDARARAYHTYVVKLTQEICGSMCWWTSHYPGKLAAVLQESTAYEALQLLKKDCEAWWYSKDTSSPLPIPARILDTQGYSHVVFLWPNANRKYRGNKYAPLARPSEFFWFQSRALSFTRNIFSM